MIDRRFSDVVLSEFCLHFLKSDLTYKMKNVLIPNLKSDNRCNIYKKLVEYLNGTTYFQFSTNLFYYVLALEPEDFGMYTISLSLFLIIIIYILSQSLQLGPLESFSINKCNNHESFDKIKTRTFKQEEKEFISEICKYILHKCHLPIHIQISIFS